MPYFAMRVKGCGFRFRGLGVCVLGGGWGFRSWIESLGFRVLGFGILYSHGPFLSAAGRRGLLRLRTFDLRG